MVPYSTALVVILFSSVICFGLGFLLGGEVGKNNGN